MLLTADLMTSFQGFMYKAPVRSWVGRWRQRFIVLEAGKLMWFPNMDVGTEPLGVMLVDGSTSVEVNEGIITIANRISGGAITMSEVDAGDAVSWAAAVEEYVAEQQSSRAPAEGNDAPLLAASSSELLQAALLSYKEETASETWSRWGARFHSQKLSDRFHPLRSLRSFKKRSDFYMTLSSPMLSLREISSEPNYQLAMWALVGKAHLPHARTITLSDLGVPRSMTSPFFPAADPPVLTYGKATSRTTYLLPSLVQLIIIAGILGEELYTATGDLSSRVCPMEVRLSAPDLRAPAPPPPL